MWLRMRMPKAVRASPAGLKPQLEALERTGNFTIRPAATRSCDWEEIKLQAESLHRNDIFKVPYLKR